MAATKLEISELDFDDVKSNLKLFLNQQTEFQDYDFEGSGMSILLDLLAYNTHYLGFNSNMLANEMFMDSADLRASLVSLAKQVGYTPTSVRAPTATLNVTVNDATASTLTITKGTKFYTLIGDTSYDFLVREDVTISPTAGVYTFSNLDVIEGTLTTFKYTVDSSDPDQRFIIPSEFADTSTLTVKVQTSSTDTSSTTYTLATGYKTLDDTSTNYFLQEVEDGKFEIYFGDGVTGKALTDGNIVILEYIVTNVEVTNGASSFTLTGTIGGSSNVSITTVLAANGGNVAESKESIRFNAPKQYTAQDRAVTIEDYKSLTKSVYANTQSVSAWGGEDHSTPIYGRVYISIKAKSGTNLTEATKESIVASLKNYAIGSVTPVIIDPEITSLLLTSTVKYDKSKTTLTAAQLKTNINTTLTTYDTDTLNQFDGVFRYSKVSNLIDDVDTSILSNITTLKLRKSFTPTIGSSTLYTISYNNAFYNPHSEHNKTAGGIVSSTGFKIDGNDNEMWLDDDGDGNIRLYYLVSGVRTYSNSTQGTIDYSTGEIVLSSLNVASISNIRGEASTLIEVTVQPSSNDIVPVRNQVLDIDVANSTITVEEDTFVGGSATAGVGYTTTSSY
jgi:hypothetical protein